MIVNEYPDRAVLAEALAETLSNGLLAAIAARGRAIMAVPGGTSPGPVLTRLAGHSLDWSKVTVLPGDERWVPPTDDRSNERLIRHCLAAGGADGARVLPLYDGSPDPEEAARKLGPELAGLLPLDICLLGMGTDGHTASLFPDAPELSEALAAPAGRPLVAMRPASVPEPRITLTATALSGARALHLIVTGAAKWLVLKEAAEPGPVEPYPVRAVLARDDIQIHYAP